MLDTAQVLRDFQNEPSATDHPAEGERAELMQIMRQFSGLLHSGFVDRGQFDAALAALVVANYVHRHDVSPDHLPDLLGQVRQALSGQSFDGNALSRALPAKPVPAVPIEASVAPNFIICLEDGRSCKSLKRYLRDHHGMTPEIYRARWGLPDNYPMVAPNFSRRRAEIARQNKLGCYERS